MGLYKIPFYKIFSGRTECAKSLEALEMPTTQICFQSCKEQWIVCTEWKAYLSICASTVFSPKFLRI